MISTLDSLGIRLFYKALLKYMMIYKFWFKFIFGLKFFKPV